MVSYFPHTSNPLSLEVSWVDITNRLARPVAEVNLFVVFDTGMGEQDIFEAEGLVPGTTFYRIPAKIFQDSQTHEIAAEYVDVRGAAQIPILEITGPLP